MKFKHFATASFCGILAAACAGGGTTQTKEIGLKDVVGNKFLVGAALNVRQSSGADTSSLKIVKRHFNSIVAENCMKSEEIQPREGEFFFDEADKFVNFGIENNMSIIGHCLIWHSQCPDWFFTDDKGNNVSPEILRQRMKTHISTVVGRYKGKIKGWDVVNEAIVEDGSYRKSKFYEILGEEFIPLAFQYAHEADPNAELYYNDYGMNVKGRREGVVKLIRSLKEKGLRIDAVGMQGHMGMDYPDIKEFEESMLAFAAEGVKVMITEWDMSALPTARQSANISDTVAFRKSLNPYPDALPDSVNTAWNKRMDEFFTLFEKHSDIVTRVTAWGVSDGDSWKNDFPVRGRKDYPLLFDRNYQPKDFIRKMIEEKDNN
ncbi:MAG: endo-1,4-beta-xylanase [Phocaeicola sp.]